MEGYTFKLLVYFLLLPVSFPMAGDPTQFGVSRGRCVMTALKQHQLTASSSRMCAFLCSQLSPCIAWSYRTGICNVSDSVQTHLLTNLTDCEWWSALDQLSRVAFWPMSNVTRTRNVLSDSGYLDLQENRVMQYAGDAVNFTGQFDADERYNIDQLASLCLKSFTISVWVKVTNPSRGPMPLLEGQIMPSTYRSFVWLYPTSSDVNFHIAIPAAADGNFQFSAVPHNVWTYIAAVYDRNSNIMKIYLNATSVTSAYLTASASCVNFGTSVQIGAINRSVPHNRVFQGYMKRFGISDRALSDSELAQLRLMCQDSGSP